MDKPDGDFRVFLSYAREDGARFAADLRKRIEEAGVRVWQDRKELEGGLGWWNQVTEALDQVLFLVLVMTPGALKSPWTRKEWQYAQQQGARVYPVKGASDADLDFPSMPKWMSNGHFFDLDHEWDTFVNYLKSPAERVRRPFMAPDLPGTFVERPDEFGQLLEHLLSGDRQNPIAITTALLGAGGFGKTTLAAALCHHDDVITAFDDGILWVTLGETPNVRDAVGKLHNALTGETAVFADVEEAARKLADKVGDRNCLIVIDDVWNAGHLRPFLRGGKGCARLVTTRNLEVVLEAAAETRRVNVDEMKVSEAVKMLIARLDPQPAKLKPFEALAKRLGEWPLLLGLVNGALRERINVRRDTIEGALRHINQTFDRRGLGAFDRTNPTERNDAVKKSIEVSLELLDEDQRRRYHETGIFPEDTGVPLTTLGALWGTDEFDTQEFAELLDQFSLLKLNLQTATVRLHDVLRAYLSGELPDQPAVHQRLLEAWEKSVPNLDSYAWRHAACHLNGAGRLQDLRRLLIDFNWLQAKLGAADYNALIADYDYFPDDADLRLIQGAIRLSSHVADKSQFAGQLHGRLLGRPGDPIANVLENARPRTRCIRPVTPSLTLAGGPLLRTLAGHSAMVTSVAVTPDGRRAVSGSDDRTIKVWDLESGQLLRTFEGHSNGVTAVAVTPDGRRAVSGSYDKTLKVWDLESGQLLRTFEGHSDGVTAVAVTPDGRRAVSGSSDKTIKVWDLESGQLLRTFENGVTAVAVTPDGRHAVSGSDDKTLKVWDLETGQLLNALEGHAEFVSTVAVTQDGQYAVSGSGDSTIKVWDLHSGQLVTTLEGHASWVSAVAVTQDGHYAVSGSWDKTIKVWDLRSGQLLNTLEGHGNLIFAVAVTPDGHRAVSGSLDGTVKVWEIDSRQLVTTMEGHADEVRAVAVASDGRCAVSGSYGGTLKIWDVDTGQLLRTIEGAGIVAAAAVTPNARHLVTGSLDGTLKVRALESGQLLRTLEGRTGGVYTVAITPDGRHAVSGSDDKTLKVWGLESGQLLHTLEGHTDWVRTVAITPDGRHAVSGSDDNTLKVWDLESGQLLTTFEGHSWMVSAVAVTPDGRHVVSGSYDKTLRIWDLESGQLLRTLDGHTGAVNAVAVTPDGRCAVSGSYDNTLKVWDLQSGNLVASFTADAGLNCCAVAPDGVTIVAGDTAGHVHFLRFEEGAAGAAAERGPLFRLLG